MAKQYGRAGKSSLEMAGKRRNVMLGIGIIGIAMIVLLGVVIQNANGLGIGGFAFLLMFGLLTLIPRITDHFMAQKQSEARRAYRGAKAEEAVESILNGLDSEEYEVYCTAPRKLDTKTVSLRR